MLMPMFYLALPISLLNLLNLFLHQLKVRVYVFFFALLFDVIHRLLLLVCVNVINLFKNSIILLHHSLHKFFEKLNFLILYLLFHLLDLLILLSTSLTYLVQNLQKLLNLNQFLFVNYVVVVFINFFLNLGLLMYLLNSIIV